ncbi:MAG: PAS domain S-box protein [Spirochaetes bacterium]|nr:PAS domain S-box protein [Spirochaetota bacterium]
MLIITILAVSAIFQFSAAFLALRLVKVTRKAVSWIVISCALFIMGVRRIIPIYYIFYKPDSFITDTYFEIFGLILSLLIFFGMLYIRPMLLERELAEERYHNLLDNMREGYHVIDRNWRYIYMNNATAIFDKRNKQEMLGHTIMEVLPGIQDTELYTALKLCMENRIPRYMENEFKIPDGDRRYFDLSIQPVPDGISVLFFDITERKKAENELEKYRKHLEELVKERTAELEKINSDMQIEMSERKRMEEEITRKSNMYRTLIDAMPDEIYAKDSENKYIMANSKVLSSFGFKEFHEIIGKTDFDLLPQKAAMASYAEENTILRARGQIINFEMPVSDSDGNIHWYAVTKIPMKDKNGQITGLVGIKRDITDFKEAEDNLEKSREAAETANRAKSTFLSSMSHEIRTPLNAIMGFSELMLHDENLTKDQKDWIGTINRSGEHLLALINDILEISRIEARRITFNPSNFNLHSMLKEIEAMFKSKAKEKNVSLIVEIPDDLPKFIETDEKKIRQIFINIVGNAVKFTEKGSIILKLITTKGKNGKMNLIARVTDTGPGIADKDIKILFQMFAQTEAGIKEGGTGLGLAISQQYAKIMGGYITVESEPGKGACFTITVEILPGYELKETNHPERRVIGLKQGESYKVLVADDREGNRKLLQEMLLSVGFKVEVAEDGLEAIKKFKSWLPDIVLMDMRMPVMDGYDATRAIKTMNTTKDKKIPIIAVTASAFQEDRLKALEAGADAYLRKPFKKHEVFECIESFLGVQYVYE